MPSISKTLVLLAAVIGLTSACEPPAPIPLQEGDITGHWLGTRWEDGARIQWLVKRDDDGNFEALFFTCYAGELVDREHQFGTSEFSNGIYQTTLDRVEHVDSTWLADEDPDGPTVYEYEIYELTDDLMVYHSIDFGNDYSASRVSEDYELGCPEPRKIDTSAGERRGRDAWIRRGIEEKEEQPQEPTAASDAETDDSEAR